MWLKVLKTLATTDLPDRQIKIGSRGNKTSLAAKNTACAVAARRAVVFRIAGAMLAAIFVITIKKIARTNPESAAK